MLDANIKWKYLRETENKFFDPNRHTTLKTYLERIFPNNTFEYDCFIPKEYFTQHDQPYRRYRPDAMCKELMLIVEFDGLSHYQDPEVVRNDIVKDNILNALGFKVVRIPYWIQLSNEVILHYFDVEVDEPMCELPYSFYDPDTETTSLRICPGSMCRPGQRRFIDEVNSLPVNTQIQVIEDLAKCMDFLPDPFEPEDVVPMYIAENLYIMWNIRGDGDDVSSSELDARDRMFFGRNYNPLYYCDHGFDSNYSFPYTTYVSFKETIDSWILQSDRSKESQDLLRVCSECPCPQRLSLSVLASSPDLSSKFKGCMIISCTYFFDSATDSDEEENFKQKLRTYAQSVNQPIEEHDDFICLI